MAAAGVDSSTADHSDHLHSESIPAIDLHLFSEPELFSLSLCSAASSLHQHQTDPDVSTVIIDRSVFNESAGSRKQTFSRIRLAPRNKSHFLPSIPHQTADQTLDDDSPQIVAILKSLVGRNSIEVSTVEDNLVSVPVQYNGFVESADAVRVSDRNGEAEMAVVDSGVKKRKRGGQRGEESNSIARFEEFGNMEDPYARELNRRTLDLQTKEQLLEFLQGLDGEWLSNRKKRKVVGASALGDLLPSGWKIMLCLMKRAGYFWVDCRRYISPNGQQFMSCKEASSSLNSSLGLQDASQLNFGHVDSNIQTTEEKSSATANAGDLTVVGKNDGALVCFSEPVQHEEKSVEVGIHGLDGTVRDYKCHKCTMIFYEPDDLLQHFLSSHKKVPKRVGQETLNEGVIFINGKYVCQFCAKSYEERHRFNGHFGNHIKDYFKRIQGSGEAMNTQRSTIPSSVAAYPSVAKIQESFGTDLGSVVTNSNSQSNDGNYVVQDCKIKGNDTDESKPGDSNDIVAVGNNSVHQGSLNCSRAAVEMEQICEPRNIDNRPVNLINGQAHKIGSDSKLVAPATIEDVENIKGRLLSNAKNSMEIHDKNFVSAHVSGNNCLSQEDVAANGIEQIDLEGCLLIPFGNDQNYASENDVQGLSSSTTVDMPSGRVSLVGLSSPLDEKAVISNDKVNRVSTSAMKESRYIGIGGSDNDVLPVGSGCNDVSVEDFATGNELESSSMKSGGKQLTSFASEQCLGSENTITKALGDTRSVTNQAEVLGVQNSTHNKGVDLVASNVTAVELESSSGNPLHVPSGNELTISFDENELLGAPENLLGKNSESNLHNKPSYDDPILKYENSVKAVSLFTADQPKEKEVKSFFEGDTHITFDGTRMEWDADADKSTIQGSYFNDCSLVSSGSQWNATGVNVTGEFKEKLKVVKPRKNDMVTGFSSNIQATENAMSDFMWKQDEESYLLRYTDTSGVANSSGCFTTYDLLSDKGQNDLFGEKFSGFQGFEVNKAFSDGTEAVQRFGSSHRLEKEALPLLPTTASKRHDVAICVWCKNEFHNEYFQSELQIGSSNPTCAACKAKFSSNFSFL